MKTQFEKTMLEAYDNVLNEMTPLKTDYMKKSYYGLADSIEDVYDSIQADPNLKKDKKLKSYILKINST